jgi:hypothetical protein
MNGTVMVVMFTVVLIALAMSAMAIGVAISGRRLRGSCGGVGGECACEKSGLGRQGKACEMKGE